MLIKDEIRKTKDQPRFKIRASVNRVLDFDTYKLECENEKLVIPHISQVKLCEGERECENKFN